MHIDKLVVLYFTDEATEEEKKIVENWRNQNDFNARQFELLELAWESRPIQKIHINQDEVGDKVWKSFVSDTSTKKRIFNIRFFAKAAAILLFFTAFAFLIIQQSKESEVSQNIVEQTKVITKSNPSGVKSTIRLPDGSNVILNSESSISYNFNDHDSTRHVELIGEAFFQVKKDELRPFIVKSGTASTEVLGTEFNVKAYPEDESTDIALLEGKVKVISLSDKLDTMILEPGQGVNVLEGGRFSEIGKIDHKEKFGWKDGTIHFRNNTLDEVLSTLSRWYGVEFELMNYSNQKWNYTAEYNDDYLEVILESMRFSQHFDYSISNKKVKIIFDKNESI